MTANPKIDCYSINAIRKIIERNRFDEIQCLLDHANHCGPCSKRLEDATENLWLKGILRQNSDLTEVTPATQHLPAEGTKQVDTHATLRLSVGRTSNGDEGDSPSGTHSDPVSIDDSTSNDSHRAFEMQTRDHLPPTDRGENKTVGRDSAERGTAATHLIDDQPPIRWGEPSSGTTIGGDYEIREKLGRGGHAIVFRAWQKSINREVALKMLILRNGMSSTSIARFEREARTIGSLEHSNIVTVYQHGMTEGNFWIAMPLLKGGTLDDRIQKDGCSIKSAVSIVRQLAEGIQYAHDNGITHRDLKPSNVLFDSDGIPKIADFGLARNESEAPLTVDTQVMGTPYYLAPELARRGAKAEEVDHRVDIYGLGLILYECLTRQRPFRNDEDKSLSYQERHYAIIERVAKEELPSPRLFNPEVPLDLETIFRKCTEKNPNKRFASAQELVDELGRFERGEPILTRPPGHIERAVKWCRRKPAQAVAIAVAFLIMFAGFVVAGVEYSHYQYQKELTSEALFRERTAQVYFTKSQMMLSQQYFKDMDLSNARLALVAIPPQTRGLDTRILAERYRNRAPKGFQVALGDWGFVAGAQSPDLKRTCLADAAGRVVVWDNRQATLAQELARGRYFPHGHVWAHFLQNVPDDELNDPTWFADIDWLDDERVVGCTLDGSVVLFSATDPTTPGRRIFEMPAVNPPNDDSQIEPKNVRGLLRMAVDRVHQTIMLGTVGGECILLDQQGKRITSVRLGSWPLTTVERLEPFGLWAVGDSEGHLWILDDALAIQADDNLAFAVWSIDGRESAEDRMDLVIGGEFASIRRATLRRTDAPQSGTAESSESADSSESATSDKLDEPQGLNGSVAQAPGQEPAKRSHQYDLANWTSIPIPFPEEVAGRISTVRWSADGQNIHAIDNMNRLVVVDADRNRIALVTDLGPRDARLAGISLDQETTGAKVPVATKIQRMLLRMGTVIVPVGENEVLVGGQNGTWQSCDVSYGAVDSDWPQIESTAGPMPQLAFQTTQPETLWALADDGALRVIDLTADRMLAQTKAHKKAIDESGRNEIVALSDGSVATVAGDRWIRFWIFSDGQIRPAGRQPIQATHPLISLAIHETAGLVAAVDRQANLNVWRLDTGEFLRELPIREPLEADELIYSGRCAFNATGDRLAAFGARQSMAAFHVPSFRPISMLSLITGQGGECLTFLPSEPNLLVATDTQPSSRVWPVDDARLSQRLANTMGQVVERVIGHEATSKRVLDVTTTADQQRIVWLDQSGGVGFVHGAFPVLMFRDPTPVGDSGASLAVSRWDQIAIADSEGHLYRSPAYSPPPSTELSKVQDVTPRRYSPLEGTDLLPQLRSARDLTAGPGNQVLMSLLTRRLPHQLYGTLHVLRSAETGWQVDRISPSELPDVDDAIIRTRKNFVFTPDGKPIILYRRADVQSTQYDGQLCMAELTTEGWREKVLVEHAGNTGHSPVGRLDRDGQLCQVAHYCAIFAAGLMVASPGSGPDQPWEITQARGYRGIDLRGIADDQGIHLLLEPHRYGGDTSQREYGYLDEDNELRVAPFPTGFDAQALVFDSTGNLLAMGHRAQKFQILKRTGETWEAWSECPIVPVPGQRTQWIGIDAKDRPALMHYDTDNPAQAMVWHLDDGEWTGERWHLTDQPSAGQRKGGTSLVGVVRPDGMVVLVRLRIGDAPSLEVFQK